MVDAVCKWLLDKCTPQLLFCSSSYYSDGKSGPFLTTAVGTRQDEDEIIKICPFRLLRIGCS